MSELKQEKKLLTFEEICPLWYQALTGKGRSKILNISDPKYCITGEAHDFEKGEKYDYGCESCYEFGEVGANSFWQQFRDYKMGVIYTAEQIQNNHVVKSFVRHWNEVHVK